MRVTTETHLTARARVRGTQEVQQQHNNTQIKSSIFVHLFTYIFMDRRELSSLFKTFLYITDKSLPLLSYRTFLTYYNILNHTINGNHEKQQSSNQILR